MDAKVSDMKVKSQAPSQADKTGKPSRFSDLVTRISGKGARAWDVHYHAQQLAAAGRDTIVLTVGDPDFATPAPIAEACYGALKAERTHYVPAGGIPALRQAIARRESKLLGREIAANEVIVSAGAQYALYASLQCLVQSGDEVVLFDPAYATFEGVVRATGAEISYVSLALDHDFGFDIARLKAAITSKTKAILLNFPHNPTGRVLRESQLDELADLLDQRDIWLIADEVYGDLCYDEAFHPAARHPKLAGRCLSIRSLSKSHAMSGWRIGWAVGPSDLIGHMEVLSNILLYGIPQFIQDAALFALSNELAEVAAMREAYRTRRDFVVERIAAIPRLSCVRPDAGIFCMIDTSATGFSDFDFCWKLVEAEGVSLLPASAFGAAGENFARLSYVYPIERLEEAMARIERFVASL